MASTSPSPKVGLTFLVRNFVVACACFCCASLPTFAFPPAPHFTLFGMVRDQYGQTLSMEGASVVLFQNGSEVLRQSITSTSRVDQNYQIRIKMDMQRFGTQTYTDILTSPGQSFSIGVVLNNIVYYPIEASISRTIGKPGERIRIDLTLGEDSDGDGIPDAWEESQLYAGGILPGANGWDLSLIDRNGDFDGDGIKNYSEYIAGTFATDASDYLSLRIEEVWAGYTQLRFFAIYGKTYSLQSSADLKNWQTVDFYQGDIPSNVTPSNPQSFLRSTTTGLLGIFTASEGNTRNYYRLIVR